MSAAGPEPLSEREAGALATIVNAGAAGAQQAMAARLVSLGALRIDATGRYVSTRLGAAHLLAELHRRWGHL